MVLLPASMAAVARPEKTRGLSPGSTGEGKSQKWLENVAW